MENLKIANWKWRLCAGFAVLLFAGGVVHWATQKRPYLELVERHSRLGYKAAVFRYVGSPTTNEVVLLIIPRLVRTHADQFTGQPAKVVSSFPPSSDNHGTMEFTIREPGLPVWQLKLAFLRDVTGWKGAPSRAIACIRYRSLWFWGATQAEFGAVFSPPITE